MKLKNFIVAGLALSPIAAFAGTTLNGAGAILNKARLAVNRIGN